MRYGCVSTTAIFTGEKDISSISGQMLNSPYVLVVDDDEAIVSVLILLLESEGHIAIGISDSRNVFPFLRQLDTQQFPSVILLDLMMPGLSGYEIADRLAQDQRYKHLPIVIMTADNRIHGADAVRGASDYIAKPFQIDTLLNKLQGYLNRGTS